MGQAGEQRRTRPDCAARTELRRLQVLQLLREGRSVRAMAAKLGASKSTIARDVAALKEEWRARREQGTEAWVAEELAKLDELERALWPTAMMPSKYQADAVEQVRGLMERRAKLLNLDAPTAIVVRTQFEVTLRAYAEKYGMDADALVSETLPFLLEEGKP